MIELNVKSKPNGLALSQHVNGEPDSSAGPHYRKKLINTKRQPIVTNTHSSSEFESSQNEKPTRASTHRKRATITNSSSNSSIKYMTGRNVNHKSTNNNANYELPIVNKYNSVQVGEAGPVQKSTVLLTQRQSAIVPTVLNAADVRPPGGGFKASVVTQRSSPPKRPSFLLAINRPRVNERTAPDTINERPRNFRLIESIVINKGNSNFCYVLEKTFIFLEIFYDST
jgi:hypothetical protein